MENFDYKPKKGYIRLSSLSAFDFCPKNFEIKYIYGKKTVSSTKAMLGKEFHRLMHLYYGEGNREFDYDLPSQMKEWTDYVINLDESRGGANIFKLEDHIENDELKLCGTIDRVDWIEKNKSVAIIDYKTGSSKYEREVKAQLAGYGVLFQLEYGFEVIELVVIYPKEEIYKVFPFNKRALKMVAQRVGKIRGTKVFPRTCSAGKYNMCELCDISLTGLV